MKHYADLTYLLRAPSLFMALLTFMAGGLTPVHAAFDPVNDDTDIFLANPNVPDQRPNVLIILDNTANWSRNVAGQAININELAALGTVVTNLTDQFNVGLMTFPETGGGNDNVDGGVVRYHIRQMTDENKTTLANLVTTMDGNADKSNNNVISLVMSEAYKYFKGDVNTSTFGKEKGDWEGNTNHETDGQSVDHALDSQAAVAYNSPINADNVCADNFIIFISNGDAAQNASSNSASETILTAECPTCATVIPLSPSGRQGNWTDEWAEFMATTDMNDSDDGEPRVYTYVVEVDPQTTGNNDDHTALMVSTAQQGKGEYFAVTSAGGGEDIVTALNTIFNEIQAVNSVFASTTLPVSVNVRGTNLNQVYIGVFRPDDIKSPRWFGNLKAYQLGFDSVTSTLFLADSTGASAENVVTGFINPSASSFWTAGSSFWSYRDSSENGDGGDSDDPDGDLVEKGGAAQQLRESYASDQSARKLYTCTSLSTDVCESGDSLSDTPFNTSNDGITSATLGLTSKDVASLSALNTITVSDITNVREVTSISAAAGSVALTNSSLVIDPGDTNGPFSITALRTGSEVGISAISNISSQVSISDARRDNPKTQATITANSHGFSNNDSVTIAGIDASDFNGTFTITVVDANNFTITKGSNFSVANPGLSSPTATKTGTTATLDTSSPHGLVGTTTVTLSGVTPNSWNSTFSATPSDSDTVTFTTNPALSPVTSVAGALMTTTSTVATATTSVAHGYSPGETVTINGASPAAYNGTFTLLSASGTSFTYDIGSSQTAATGTILVNQSPTTVLGTITCTSSVDCFSDLGFAIDGSATITNAIITGATPSGYNGTRDITIQSDTTYTYVVSSGLLPGTATLSSSTVSFGGAASTDAIATIPNHQFGDIGDTVTLNIAGANEANYNNPVGTATIVDANTLSYTLPGAESDPATGTIRAWVDNVAYATVDVVRDPATWSQTLNTITVNQPAHGLSVNSVIFLDVTTGSAASGAYKVATVPDDDTFTVTSAVSLTDTGTADVEGHGYVGGESVTIAGADDATYNVTGTVVVGDPTDANDTLDPYTFRIPITGSDVAADTSAAITASNDTLRAFANVVEHGYSDGDTVTIAGASPSSPFNGAKTITVIDVDNFYYAVSPAQGEADVTGATASGVSVAAQEVIDLINWVRGADNREDENDNNSFSDIRASIHGDVLHSRPAVVNYNRHGNDNDVYIFYGANDGIFRGVKGGFAQSDAGEPLPGNEAWGFIPEEFFNDLSRLRLNTPLISSSNKKPYFADGSIGVYVNDENNDGILDPTNSDADDTVWMFISMHRGGRLIYALDVSDPQDPVFKWKKSNADWTELGQTWSVPQVTTINYQAGPVLIFGGGYDPLVDDVDPATITAFNEDDDTDDNLEIVAGTARYERSQGRSIFVADADTGDLIFQAGGDGVIDDGAASTYLTVSGMDCAIPGDAAIITNNGGSVDNRAYFGDTCGQIWRFDFDDADPANWTVTRLANLTTTTDIPKNLRKFLFPPDVVYADNFDAVLIGSGDREHPFDTEVENRFYMLRDLGTSTTAVTTDLTESDLADLTDNCLQDPSCTNAELVASTAALDSGSGWYIKLSDGEKVVGNAVTLNNVTFFNTNSPSGAVDADTCASDLGTARQYQVNYDDATAYLDKNLDGVTDAADRSVTHPGGGYLPSPVPVVVEIDGQIHEGVISGVKVEQPPGSLLGARLRKFWFKEFE